MLGEAFIAHMEAIAPVPATNGAPAQVRADSAAAVGGMVCDRGGVVSRSRGATRVLVTSAGGAPAHGMAGGAAAGGIGDGQEGAASRPQRAMRVPVPAAGEAPAQRRGDATAAGGAAADLRGVTRLPGGAMRVPLGHPLAYRPAGWVGGASRVPLHDALFVVSPAAAADERMLETLVAATPQGAAGSALGEDRGSGDADGFILAGAPGSSRKQQRASGTHHTGRRGKGRYGGAWTPGAGFGAGADAGAGAGAGESVSTTRQIDFSSVQCGAATNRGQTAVALPVAAPSGVAAADRGGAPTGVAIRGVTGSDVPARLAGTARTAVAGGAGAAASLVPARQPSFMQPTASSRAASVAPAAGDLLRGAGGRASVGVGPRGARGPMMVAQAAARSAAAAAPTVIASAASLAGPAPTELARGGGHDGGGASATGPTGRGSGQRT